MGLLVLGFTSLVLCNGTLACAFGMFTRFGIAGFLLLSFFILFKSTGGGSVKQAAAVYLKNALTRGGG